MDRTAERVCPAALLRPESDKHSKHSLWLLASAPRQVRYAGIPPGWTSQLLNRAPRAATAALKLRPRLKRVGGLARLFLFQGFLFAKEKPTGARYPPGLAS